MIILDIKDEIKTEIEDEDFKFDVTNIVDKLIVLPKPKKTRSRPFHVVSKKINPVAAVRQNKFTKKNATETSSTKKNTRNPAKKNNIVKKKNRRSTRSKFNAQTDTKENKKNNAIMNWIYNSLPCDIKKSSEDLIYSPPHKLRRCSVPLVKLMIEKKEPETPSKNETLKSEPIDEKSIMTVCMCDKLSKNILLADIKRCFILKDYKCPHCNFKVTEKNILLNHLKDKHRDSEIYGKATVEYCPKYMKMVKKERQAKKNNLKNDRKHCPKCPGSFSSHARFIHHSCTWRFACLWCNHSSAGGQTFRNHLDKCHS